MLDYTLDDEPDAAEPPDDDEPDILKAEVEAAIKKLRTNKSAGANGVVAEMIMSSNLEEASLPS